MSYFWKLPDEEIIKRYKESNSDFSVVSIKREKNEYGGAITLKCNNCNNTFSRKYREAVKNYTVNCPFCGDGISYPNKFCRAFLDQLPIGDYEAEWQPEWHSIFLGVCFDALAAGCVQSPLEPAC